MLKRMLSALLALALALSLAACGGEKSGQSGSPDSPKAPDPDAPAHEQLLAQAEAYLTAARDKSDMGLTLQGEYCYGQAQAAVSSLRYAVDIILWLMGEGESLADVTAGAPYRDWDDIVAAGMGCPAPYYFEGLVLEIQGKSDEAQVCYDRAAANPVYEEQDFWYLRSMSVESLYALRETVLETENEIYGEYTPPTVLCTETRGGREYAPVYHLMLASQAAADGYAELAWQCARNALAVNPTQAEFYGAAAAYGLDAGKKAALDIINEGLLVFPEDGLLNYMAGAAALAAEDTDAARAFLETAQSCGDEDVARLCQQLLTQMG